MVVLDTKGMLSAGSNQYLQPDYLSPLPTTLDSKKSPLALLAQTCSQIGADSSKPLPTEKKKEEEKKDKAPTPTDVPRRSPAFKPYESCSSKRSADDSGAEDSAPKSSSNRPPSSSHTSNNRSPSTSSSGGGSSSSLKEESGRRSSEALTVSSASTTPIIRSGLEILAGHPKDVPLGTYRTGMPSLLPPGYPGLETHPALRGAPPGLFHPGLGMAGLTSLASSYPSAAAAAALYSNAGFASSGLTSSLMGSTSPYLTYTRVKTTGGGETIVPVCRDPYCTGCPYSLQNNHLLQSGGACPPSCTQCEQAKAALSALPSLSSIPPSSLVPASSLLPPTTVSAASSLYPGSPSSLLSGPHRPYICNWIVADTYCGKRFGTSEELLQHLRTHTNISATENSALSLLSNPLHAHAALLGSASALHRPGASYPPPALSPLAAARYHPYSKPHTAFNTSLTATLPGVLPYPHSPLTAAAGYPPGYPSHYSLYPRPPL